MLIAANSNASADSMEGGRLDADEKAIKVREHRLAEIQLAYIKLLYLKLA